MGVLDKINFKAAKTPPSSFDFRLLDTPCDHLVRNEQVKDFSMDDLIDHNQYSGTSTIYNNFPFNNFINPDASTLIKTALPMVNDGGLVVFQYVDTDVDNQIIETTTVPTDITQPFNLIYPPKTNSVTAKQKIYVNSTDYRLINFDRYNLSQLFGKITFTDEDDIGEEIVFTYLSDKKQILQKNKDSSKNYEIVGLDQSGKGIIKIYGRAILSTNTKLILKYHTPQQYCQKCSGKGELNDIFFDENGKIQQVYDFSKLIQDFFKRLLTVKGSSVFDIDEGTSLPTLIGIAKADGLVLDNLVKAEIVNLLYTIRNKQSLQQDMQGVGSAEQIGQINSIDVRATGPTEISIAIEVMSKSGIIQQISSTVRR
jgi:hypothetical protein